MGFALLCSVIGREKFTLVSQPIRCKTKTIDIGSTNDPLIDNFLDSHHLFAWYCIDIVKWNSV